MDNSVREGMFVEDEDRNAPGSDGIDRLCAAKDHIVQLQKRTMNLEDHLLENATKLFCVSHKLVRSQHELQEANDQHQVEQASMESRLATYEQRIKLAPAIDKAVQHAYFEIRSMAHSELGLPPLGAGERNSVHVSPTLSVISRLHLWQRRVLTAMKRRVQSAVDDHEEPGTTPGPLPVVVQSGDNVVCPTCQCLFFLKPPTRIFTEAEKNRKPKRTDDPEVIPGNEMLRQEVTRLNDVIAKGDNKKVVEALRLQIVALERTIDQLRNTVDSGGHRGNAQLAAAAIAKKEAAEVQREAAILVGEKQRQIESLGKQHAVKVETLKKEITSLRQFVHHNALQQRDLDEKDKALTCVETQLARSDVAGLRQTNTQLREQVSVAEEKVRILSIEMDSAQRMIRVLAHGRNQDEGRSGHQVVVTSSDVEDSSKTKHVTVVAASNRSGQSQQTTGALRAAQAEVVSYKQLCENLKGDLERTERRMRQLMLEAHHDRIENGTEIARLRRELVATRQQTSLTANELRDFGSDDIDVDQTARRDFLDRDNTSSELHPKLLVAPGYACLEESFVARQSNNHFGNPTRSVGVIIANTKAYLQDHHPQHEEVSPRLTHEVLGVESPSMQGPQIVQRVSDMKSISQETIASSRRPRRLSDIARRIPLSVRNARFDFGSVGKPRMSIHPLTASVIQPVLSA